MTQRIKLDHSEFKMEYDNPSKRIKLDHSVAEDQNHLHPKSWSRNNHYGMCGQSCPCCRAEMETEPLGVCPICWKLLEK